MAFDDLLNDLMEHVPLEDIEGFPMPVTAQEQQTGENWSTVVEERVADFKVSFRLKMVDADMSGEPAKIVAPLEVADWGDGGVDEGVQPATPAEPGMTGDEGVEPGMTGEPDAPAMNRAAEAACAADEGPRQPRTRRQLDDLDDGRSTLFECRTLA